MRDNMTLDGVVVALCLDFERRKNAIENKSFCRRTLMEYKYINERIYEAAAEIVGEADAELYINEIGGKIGYAKSDMPWLSEGSYKRNKNEVKRNIAKKLHLTD